jgi:hypothetical protein
MDPYHEDGWLWLSGVVDSPEDQRTCLENVLAVNPANEKARKGLEFLSGKRPANPAPEPSPPPPPAERATVSSVEWDFGAADAIPPVSARAVAEPTAQDYDDWVSGLNLQQANPKDPAQLAAAVSASPFVGFDDEFFNAAPVPDPRAVLSADEPAFARPLPASSAIPYQPPPVFDEPDPVPAAPPINPFEISADSRPGLSAPVPMPIEPLEEELQVESEMFPTIPKSVKATRLPGTNERGPVLLKLLAVVLLVANVAAGVLLAARVLSNGA